ncbi:MAG: hypothetical protein RR135_06075 [Oscillospiraceae bacterium]
MERNNRIRRTRRRRIAGPLGILLFVLAIIGLMAVILWVGHLAVSLFDDSAAAARYEKFVQPVVMMDPVPFARIENIDEITLLQSSLWGALLGENRGNYAQDDNGLLLIPSSDVDVAAARLFGPSVRLNHQTFDDYDVSYLFDPEISAYRVPYVAKVAYSPKVVSIDKKGDTISLKVGYVSPGNILSTSMAGENGQKGPLPDKYMYYDLQNGEDGYYIKAVRDLENAMAIS